MEICDLVHEDAGQFLASTFPKITLMTILWLPSQCNAMGCRLQQHCAGLLLLSPKAVVNLVVIAAIHPSGAAGGCSGVGFASNLI